MATEFSKRKWKRMNRIQRLWQRRKQNSPARGVRTSLQARNRQLLNKLSDESDLEATKDVHHPVSGSKD